MRHKFHSKKKYRVAIPIQCQSINVKRQSHRALPRPASDSVGTTAPNKLPSCSSPPPSTFDSTTVAGEGKLLPENKIKFEDQPADMSATCLAGVAHDCAWPHAARSARWRHTPRCIKDPPLALLHKSWLMHLQQRLMAQHARCCQYETSLGQCFHHRHLQCLLAGSARAACPPLSQSACHQPMMEQS